MTYPELEVVISDFGTTRTVTPRGEIDVASVDRVRRPLRAALADQRETVVLDLAQTTFLDSTGIRLIMELDARARVQGVRFVVLPGPPEVQRVFEVCGLTDLVQPG